MADTVIPIDDLSEDAGNVRKRTARSLDVIGNSLKQFGAARSIVMDSSGVVRAGNGTLHSAKSAGIKRVRVIESDGTELIAVKRTDLSGPEAIAYAIADNRSSDLSTWAFEDLEQQLEALKESCDLESLGFTPHDMDVMFGTEDGERAAVDVPEDVEYRVVVQVKDEHDQAAVIALLEERGYECQPLMS